MTVTNPIPPEPTTTVTQEEAIHTSSLCPDEENFPKLPTPSRKLAYKDTQEQNQSSPVPTATPHFVWCNQASSSELQKGGERGKGKQVSRTPDLAPITRQGYRSGRLADDFWIAPHIPASQKKTIRVIPILIKEGKEETSEYLVNTKAAMPNSIAQVHIAELLAGVPWTEARARQHVVNEVAQALYKILVFSNPSANPLQKWRQGRWFASWEGDSEGGYMCTLFVMVGVQESKIKPRRGHSCGWNKLPTDLKNRIKSHTSEEIEEITEDKLHWIKLFHLVTNNNPTFETKATNRFAILGEESITST